MWLVVTAAAKLLTEEGCPSIPGIRENRGTQSEEKRDGHHDSLQYWLLRLEDIPFHAMRDM